MINTATVTVSSWGKKLRAESFIGQTVNTNYNTTKLQPTRTCMLTNTSRIIFSHLGENRRM